MLPPLLEHYTKNENHVHYGFIKRVSTNHTQVAANTSLDNPTSPFTHQVFHQVCPPPPPLWNSKYPNGRRCEAVSRWLNSIRWQNLRRHVDDPWTLELEFHWIQKLYLFCQKCHVEGKVLPCEEFVDLKQRYVFCTKNIDENSGMMEIKPAVRAWSRSEAHDFGTKVVLVIETDAL